MSTATLQTSVDATLDHTDTITALRLRGAVVIRGAAAIRQAVRELIETSDPWRHVVIDLSAIDELDAAGLAAVTSPVLRARRYGRTVSVVPPVAAAPRRLADRIGVLPIGAG